MVVIFAASSLDRALAKWKYISRGLQPAVKSTADLNLNPRADSEKKLFEIALPRRGEYYHLARRYKQLDYTSSLY